MMKRVVEKAVVALFATVILLSVTLVSSSEPAAYAHDKWKKVVTTGDCWTVSTATFTILVCDKTVTYYQIPHSHGPDGEMNGG